MRILIISRLATALSSATYCGPEMLSYQWARETARQGHQVTVIAPKGSRLPQDIEILSTGIHEPEESAYERYRDKLTSGEFDVILDNSQRWYSVLSQMTTASHLPIIHMCHSKPSELGPPPPIEFPCIVSPWWWHAHIVAQKWREVVRVTRYGIDLPCFNLDSAVNKGNRYLLLANNFLEKARHAAACLARLREINLGAFRDDTAIADQNYFSASRAESDRRQLVILPSVDREEAVRQYRSHKALIVWSNYVDEFALVIIECQACGTPVIVSDLGASRELVRERETGLVVGSLGGVEDIIRNDRVSLIKPEDCRRNAEKFSIQQNSSMYLSLMQEVAQGIRW